MSQDKEKSSAPKTPPVREAGAQGSAGPAGQDKNKTTTQNDKPAKPKRKILTHPILTLIGAFAGGLWGGIARFHQLSAGVDMASCSDARSIDFEMRFNGLEKGTKAAEAITQAATTGAFTDKVKAGFRTVQEMDKKGKVVSKIPGGSFTIVATAAMLGAVVTAGALRRGVQKQKEFNEQMEELSRNMTPEEKIDAMWRASVLHDRTEEAHRRAEAQQSVIKAVGAFGAGAGRG